jgi:pyrimidine operon attenuation protein / uracil phosphoribosyltransferase
MRTLLSATELDQGLASVAGQIAERHRDKEVVLIGVRRGGDHIVTRLAHWLANLPKGTPAPRAVALGSVDITLYRDDAAGALPNPRIGPSSIPGDSVEGRHVVLVDDVLHTRRTTRAAIDAVLDYGRPADIELAVVVDRGGRQLPIQPDYTVLKIDTVTDADRIDVVMGPSGLYAVIQPFGAPSIPPPAR